MSWIDLVWKTIFNLFEEVNVNNHQIECDKHYSDTCPNNLKHCINPASGIPMIGAIDAAGNPLGINYAEMDRQTYDFHRRSTDDMLRSFSTPCYDSISQHYDSPTYHYNSNY